MFKNSTSSIFLSYQIQALKTNNLCKNLNNLHTNSCTDMKQLEYWSKSEIANLKKKKSCNMKITWKEMKKRISFGYCNASWHTSLIICNILVSSSVRVSAEPWERSNMFKKTARTYGIHMIWTNGLEEHSPLHPTLFYIIFAGCHIWRLNLWDLNRKGNYQTNPQETPIRRYYNNGRSINTLIIIS